MYIVCFSIAEYISLLKEEKMHPYQKLFQEKVPRSNPKVARSAFYQAEYSLS